MQLGNRDQRSIKKNNFETVFARLEPARCSFVVTTQYKTNRTCEFHVPSEHIPFAQVPYRHLQYVERILLFCERTK